MESRFQTEETSKQERTLLSALPTNPIAEGAIETELPQQEIVNGSATTQSAMTQQEISTQVKPHTRQLDPVGYQVLAQLKKMARLRWMIYWTLGILSVLLAVLIPHIFPIDKALSSNIAVLVTTSVLVFMYGHSWIDRQRTRRELERIDDVRMVGPLAEALDEERYIKPTPIIAALRRLLPKMQQSDAKSLTPAQRACLYRALYRRRSRSRLIFDKGLALEILKAMRQIGDREAVPHVKRVATWSGDSQLRDAANDCLPFLMAQEEEFNRSQTYLRPSSASEIETDSLLRASIEEVPTKPEELLRAADGTSTIDNGR